MWKKMRSCFISLMHLTFIRYLLSDKLHIKLIFRLRMGYWLDLKRPKTFNEKLQWLKLHNHNLEYTNLVDKFTVREHIEKTIGKEYLIPLLGVWDKFDDINFDSLPNQFVLKCTHNSGGNIICTDKNVFDIAFARKKMNNWLKRNFFYCSREFPYKNIKPRIIAERYMVDESGEELKDYKIFCFNGIPKMLFVATDRNINRTKFDFFDIDFNHLTLSQHYPNNTLKKIQKPEGLSEMLSLAAILTTKFTHCRVDFYDINGRIYFGELTFFHFSGFEKFEPEEWDNIMGTWLELPSYEVK